MRALFLASLLGATLAFGQSVGQCGPGRDCRPFSVTPSCVPYTSLPSCSASRKGTLVNDCTNNCLARCDGTNWLCAGVLQADAGVAYPLVIANGGTAGSAAPTAGAVAYGNGSAYAFSAGPTDSGYPLVGVPGGTPVWGGDVVSNSFTATTSGNAISIPTAGAKLCLDSTCTKECHIVSSTWACSGLTLQVNGGFNTTGVYNSGTSAGNNALTCTNVGCRLSLGNTSRYISDDGAGFALTAYLNAPSGAYVGQAGTGPLVVRAPIQNDVTNAPVTINDTQGLALVGLDVASFATCNNTAPPSGTRGLLQFDTTAGRYKACQLVQDGGTAYEWQTLLTTP